jgi:N-acetyltransferase
MTFDRQPTLVGPRLTVRPLRADDHDALYAVACDPLLWEQHPEPDRYRPEVFREFFAGGLASGGALVVVSHADGRVLGSSRYANLKPESAEVEIGWTFLARDHWGGSWNGELKTLMLTHAFRTLERVVFTVGLGNIRSQRALERIGARSVREFDRARPDGTMGRHVVFAIERSEWQQRER